MLLMSAVPPIREFVSAARRLYEFFCESVFRVTRVFWGSATRGIQCAKPALSNANGRFFKRY
jgi:hypothetical protein